MANSKDVELRIRARDFSQKPLNAVTSAIEAMAKAQDDQRKAAERGEVSTRELEASYKRLEQAGQQLLKLNALVELYKRQNASMTEAAQSPIVAHYAQAAQGGQVTYTAKDYRTGVKMRFFLNDTVAALSYLKAGRVKEGLRGLGDFFTAKEALSAKGDGKVMRAYLKKSLFER